MFLIFLVYAATGVIFFKDNDPYHFGNIGMAMWSYFEMTTLDVSLISHMSIRSLIIVLSIELE